MGGRGSGHGQQKQCAVCDQQRCLDLFIPCMDSKDTDLLWLVALDPADQKCYLGVLGASDKLTWVLYPPTLFMSSSCPFPVSSSPNLYWH